MSIRRGPIPADSFTIIDNRWLRDPRLSWKAKGLLSYIASHAPGHQLTTEQIHAESTDGPDGVRSGLAELERAGYLQRIELRDGRGHRTGTDYELRNPPSGESPVGESPTGGDLPERDISAGGSQSGKSQVGESGGKKTKPLEDQENTSSSFDADASPNAGLIVKGFIDWLAALPTPVKLTPSVIARYGKAIKSLLQAHYEVDTIKRALVLQTERGKAGWPSMLDSFCVEVQNRPVSAPPAGPRQPQFKNSAEQQIERAKISKARSQVLDALMERGATFDEAKAHIESWSDGDFLKAVAPSTVTGYIEGDVIDSTQRPEVES